MEQKGMAWNNFASEIGGEIDGHYNADLLDFNMFKNINGIKVTIWGLRNLTNVVTNFVPTNGEIVEELTIKFEKNNLSQTNLFSIKRNNLLNNILSTLSSFKKIKRSKKFIVHYNTDYTFNELMSRNILSYNNLNKVKLNKNGFILQMFYLPQEINSLNKILDFCVWITKLK